MSGKNVPPDIAGEFASLKRRVLDLERQLGDLWAAYRPEIVFSLSGPVTASESPVWTRREAGRLVEVVALLRVPGSTDTEVEIQKNGVAALTVVVLAGQPMVRVATAIAYRADQDVLHDVVTAAGAGAEDLTVIHRFKR